MATPIKIPDIGTNVEEVTLLKWRKTTGEQVARGDILAEIVTDKSVVELESVAEGVLLSQEAREGDVLKQGTVIAYVGSPGEKVLQPAVGSKEKPARNLQERQEGTVSSGKATPQQIKISPAVRNLAERLGVDISQIQGTGQGGLITRQDVLDAKQSGIGAGAAGRGEKSLGPAQLAVVRNVTRSHREIPPAHFTVVVDMEQIITMRKARADAGTKIPFDAFIISAAARALKEFPQLRTKFGGAGVIEYSHINPSVAIAAGDDLFIATIRDAERKSVEEIGTEIFILSEKAKRHALGPAEMQDSCFLVSNLGMYPVESFDAIIYPEHSAALAVGRIAAEPVVREGVITARSVCRMTLSVDHRIVNGTTAAAFLARVKQILEIGEF